MGERTGRKNSGVKKWHRPQDRGTIFFEHLRRHGLEEVADLSADPDREVQVAKTLLREELRRGRGSVKVHWVGRGRGSRL